MSKMKDKYKYLGKNTIIFGISSFSTKFLSFLLVPVYTAVLSTYEYGIADLINTTTTLLIYILTINISSSILRFTLEQREREKEILSYGVRIVLRGSLICAVGMWVIYWLGVLDWPLYYFCFIILLFFATAFYELMANYLRGIGKIIAVAVSGIISAFVVIISNILFLLVVKLGIIGYLISFVAGPLIATVYCMIAARKPISIYIYSSCEKQLCKEMVAYCIPLIFNNIALWINAFLDRYFVTAICGVSENGVYSAASKIPNILAISFTAFGQAWNLSAIKEFDSEDKDGFFSKTYKIYGTLMTVGCSFVILLNIPLARFLYSRDFFAAWQYSSVLLIATMFNTFTAFIGSVFSAVKHTKIIAETTVISAIVNICLNVMLIPLWGVLGAAIATAIAYVVMWIVRLIYLRQFIRLRINLVRDIITYILLAIQVIFEHMDRHCYVGQSVCFLIIVILNIKQIMSIAGTKARSIRT